MASWDAVPWLQAAFVAPLSYALAGVVEYVRVGRDAVLRLASLSDARVGAAAGVEAGAVAGVAAGAGPLRLASRPVSLRLVLGAGVATVRNGTAFAG
jgi:ABC-type cobalamin transport system permease subunit